MTETKAEAQQQMAHVEVVPEEHPHGWWTSPTAFGLYGTGLLAIMPVVLWVLKRKFGSGNGGRKNR